MSEDFGTPRVGDLVKLDNLYAGTYTIGRITHTDVGQYPQGDIATIQILFGGSGVITAYRFGLRKYVGEVTDD